MNGGNLLVKSATFIARSMSASQNFLQMRRFMYVHLGKNLDKADTKARNDKVDTWARTGSSSVLTGSWWAPSRLLAKGFAVCPFQTGHSRGLPLNSWVHWVDSCLSQLVPIDLITLNTSWFRILPPFQVGQPHKRLRSLIMTRGSKWSI